MLTTHVKPLSHLLRALHAPCGSRLPCLSTGNQNHPKPIWDMLTSCREQTGVISLNINTYVCWFIYMYIYIYMILFPNSENHKDANVAWFDFHSAVFGLQNLISQMPLCLSGLDLELWAYTVCQCLFLLVWHFRSKAWCFKISGPMFGHLAVG